MLKENFKIFLLFVIIIFLLILFKNGRIFDIGVVFRGWLTQPITMNSLLKPPSELEENYKNLLAENNQLRVLEKENKQLKDLLGLKQENDFSLLVAKVIGRDALNRSILTIDLGWQDQIIAGQPVVINQGIIIGKIIKVNADSAQVRLLTDSFSKLAVQTDQLKEISGILTGSLGLGMNLEYIPQDYEIKKGDLLVTADLDPLIPAGLSVGYVEELKYSEEELFKKAIISPLADYNTLSIVAVITSL